MEDLKGATKFFEKNIVLNLYNLGIGNRALDMTPKMWATKEKLDKSDFIETKNFHPFKVHKNLIKGHYLKNGKNICQQYTS